MSDPWLCESLRLTALWRAPSGAESTLSWEALVGAAPETRESQPRQGTTRDAGPIGDGSKTLELRTAAGRVDWLLLPTVNPTVLLDLSRSIPSLGEVEQAIQIFDALLFEKAANAYAAPRLAIAVTANHRATDRNASYAELEDILSTISPKLEGASDFQYQINRPRASAVAADVTINRLARWGSVVMAGVSILPPMLQQLPGVLSQFQSPQVHATRIELDISTSVDRDSELPLEIRVPLMREMAASALEIIRNGDRA